MSSVVQLKEYTIPKITVNFENIRTGELAIEMNTSINMIIPKAKTDPLCGIEIKTEVKDSNRQILVFAALKAKAEFRKTDYTSDVKREHIKKELIPDLYNKLRDYICIVLEKANIDYMTIPLYEELQP